eukprot:TRINITY_DN24332_c0_g1_i1.p1 TRINITY_DN24332_c0_g1~~TRINITY_DN24332_c0_g1_i1.p1  ORF type:complete len:635 (+),score=81.81 TRINITY_DN24332_c0_g1_i1:143-2047(+)
MSRSNAESSPSLLRSLPAVTCLVGSSPSLQCRRGFARDLFANTPPSAEKPEYFDLGSDQKPGSCQRSRSSGINSTQDWRPLQESRASSADSSFWDKSPCAFHPVHARSRCIAWGQNKGLSSGLQAAAEIEGANFDTTTCPSEIRRTLFDALDEAAGRTVQVSASSADVDRSMPSTSSWMLPSRIRPLSPPPSQEQRAVSAGTVSKAPCVYSISTPSPAKPFQPHADEHLGNSCTTNPLIASGEDWALLHRAHTWCSRPSVTCGGNITLPGSPILHERASLTQVEKSTPGSAGTLLQASPCFSSPSTGPGDVSTSSETADEKIRSLTSRIHSTVNKGIPPLPIRHDRSESAPLQRRCGQIGIVPKTIGLENIRCDQAQVASTENFGCSAYFASGRWIQQDPPSPTHSDIECALESMSTPPRRQSSQEQSTSQRQGTQPESCCASAGQSRSHTVVEQPCWRHTQTVTQGCNARIAERSGVKQVVNCCTIGLVEQPSCRTRLPVGNCVPSKGSTTQAGGAFANAFETSAMGAMPSTPVSSRYSRRLHEAELLFESKSLGVCDDSQSVWQQDSTPDAAINPRPRPTTSLLAAARDQFKTSVGALGRSSEFCFERLRKLDAISASPKGCENDDAVRELV